MLCSAWNGVITKVLLEVWPPLEVVDAQNLRLETEVAREGRRVKGRGAQDFKTLEEYSNP